MLSKLTNVLMPVASRGRLASMLAVLALLLAAAAGCGGGGEDGKATDDKTATGQKDDKADKPKVPRGGVIKSFEIKVGSPTQATITTTLSKASPLTLNVRRLAGSQKIKVGRVNLGTKPAGRSTINWNLTAADKKLTPGRYRIVLRAGSAGKSAPKVITVPGG
jgi:hypothetical protein